MKAKYWIAILGILVIGSLEAFAISKGIDGTLFSAATAGIGGIVGWVVRGPKSS